MAGYGQHCPVAKAMELLDERWTVLVVRELLMGSQRFNELKRGVPRMSPTLLSRRLRQLVASGVVVRTPDGRYLPTAAGTELLPVVEALGVWGARWVGELGDPDLDPQLLLWDVHRRVDLTALPPGRTVLQFTFPDVEAARRRWWLVMTRDGTDVCDTDPGYEVSAVLEGSLREVVRLWRGDTTWASARRSGAVRVLGAGSHVDAVPLWLLRGVFAGVPRPPLPLHDVPVVG